MASQKPKKVKPSWQAISVPLVKLHLDVDNFRHVPVKTEEEAILWLCTHEKVEALARDIVEQGTTSPLDRIGVFPMPGNPTHVIAAEGNRRVCALLLLNDPDRAPDVTSRATYRELARGFEVPRAVEVVRFDNKAAARHWVDLRHLGPQGGQGPRPWDATQKQRAAGDKGTNALAVAVLDRAKDGQWLGSTSAPAVTTLTRYLKNREVRAALGLGHHRELTFTHDAAQVDAALRQFLLDALPTSDGTLPLVNSRSNDTARATYARELRTRNVAPTQALPQPITPPTAGPSGKPKVRSKQDPFNRTYLVPGDFVVKCADQNLRALFVELRRTPIDRHEFANKYLLRAVVERVMSLYARELDPGFNPSNDQALVVRCSQLLDPEKKNPAKLKPFRTAASNADASHSLHTLGAAVHASILMDRRALIMAWGNWEFALSSMLAALQAPP